MAAFMESYIGSTRSMNPQAQNSAPLIHVHISWPICLLLRLIETI